MCGKLATQLCKHRAQQNSQNKNLNVSEEIGIY